MNKSTSSFKKASLLCGLLFVSPALMLGESHTSEAVDQAKSAQKAITDKTREQADKAQAKGKEALKAKGEHTREKAKHAEEGKSHEKSDSDGDLGNSQFAERILSASPEELAKIRVLIDRIEKMSPEQKEQALTRIRENRREFGERRRAFHNLSPEQREALRNMSPEERQKTFQQMFPDAPRERGAQQPGREGRRPRDGDMQRGGPERRGPEARGPRRGPSQRPNADAETTPREPVAQPE